MPYSKQTWVDGQSELTAARMNAMENGIETSIDFTNEARNTPLIGGGTITWGVNEANRVHWSSRFLLIPASTAQSSSQHVNFVYPTGSVLAHDGTERRNANGILLNVWEGLWAKKVRGTSEAAGITYHVRYYTADDLFDDDDAHLICVRDGDSGNLCFANGLVLAAGRSSSAGNTASHPIFSTTHSDVDTADVRADGDVLVWRPAGGKYVHEQAGASTVPDATSTTSGKTRLDRDPVTATAPIAIGLNSLLFETFIQGLNLTWLSASSVRLETGSAWVPGLNRILNVPTAITVTGLTFAPNTLYHFYLWENAGAAALEVSTTAPVLYKGEAKHKSADASRRYIISGYSNGAATPGLRGFYMQSNRLMYQRQAADPSNEVLTNGLATTYTNIDCTFWIPPSTRYAVLRFNNLDTVTYVQVKNSETTADEITSIKPGGFTITEFPLNASQFAQYQHISPPTAGFYVNVLGYVISR